MGLLEGVVVDPVELDKECICFGVCSDDYIGLETSVSPLYRDYCDKLLGLELESEVKSLEEGVEFLRFETFRKEGYMYSRRATERVLNKIYYGTDDTISMIEGILSVAHQVGENEELYNALRDLYYVLLDYVGREKVVGQMVTSSKVPEKFFITGDFPKFDYFRDFQTFNAKTIRERAMRLEYGLRFGVHFV
jgi:hypothetical protein